MICANLRKVTNDKIENHLANCQRYNCLVLISECRASDNKNSKKYCFEKREFKNKNLKADKELLHEVKLQWRDDMRHVYGSHWIKKGASRRTDAGLIKIHN